MKLKDYISNSCEIIGKQLTGIMELEIKLDENLNVSDEGNQKINLTIHNIK